MHTKEKSCCFTGYRPEKFDFKFIETDEKFKVFTKRLLTAISKTIESGCTTFYTGMACGFDIIAAEHLALMKCINKNLKLVAVIPFKDQAKNFSPEWKHRYEALLKSCNETIVLNDVYEKWVFAQRNRYMVDHSSFCITYFDGKPGGTKNTLKYASKHNLQILNVYTTDPLSEKTDKYSAYFKLIPPSETYNIK